MTIAWAFLRGFGRPASGEGAGRPKNIRDLPGFIFGLIFRAARFFPMGNRSKDLVVAKEVLRSPT